MEEFWVYWPLEPTHWMRLEARMKRALSLGSLLSDSGRGGGGSSGYFLACLHNSGWHDRKRGRHTIPRIKIMYLMGPFPMIQKRRLCLGDEKTLPVAFEMLLNGNGSNSNYS